MFIHTIRFRKLDKYIIHNWIIHTKKSSYQLSCFLAWFYLIQNVRKIRFTLRPKSFWFFYICVFAKCFLSLSWSIVLFKSFVMIFWAKMFSFQKKRKKKILVKLNGVTYWLLEFDEKTNCARIYFVKQSCNRKRKT